jgi:hypothetical protein
MRLLAWSMSVKVTTVIASKAKQSRILKGQQTRSSRGPLGSFP